MDNFSITQVIRDYITKKGISQKKLAELLNNSPSNFNQKFKKNDMDMNLVREICIALKYDFFMEASKSLPYEIRGSVKKPNTSEIEKALRNFIESNYPKMKK